jgi:hypothetical protein
MCIIAFLHFGEAMGRAGNPANNSFQQKESLEKDDLPKHLFIYPTNFTLSQLSSQTDISSKNA